MGEFLAVPNKEKHSQDGESDFVHKNNIISLLTH